MDVRTIVTNGRALGVARLVLLTLATAGFLAMHGVAATDPVGGHYSPMDPPLTVHHAAPHPGEASPSVTPTVATMTAAPMSHSGSDDHDDMAACMFVLISVIAAVALHALRGGFGTSSPSPLALPWEGRGSPRAPPRPIFLSLCVLRL